MLIELCMPFMYLLIKLSQHPREIDDMIPIPQKENCGWEGLRQFSFQGNYEGKLQMTSVDTERTQYRLQQTTWEDSKNVFFKQELIDSLIVLAMLWYFLVLLQSLGKI